MNKLENEIKELQELVSQYEIENFVGNLSIFITYNAEQSNTTNLHKFGSKLKDLLYLISLNVFSKNKGDKCFKNPKELELLADKLNIIKQFNYSNKLTDYNQDSVIHEMALRNHFDNGVLSYFEQDIERLKRVFSPYQSNIEEEFGVDLDFVIEFCRKNEQLQTLRKIESLSYINTEEYKRFIYDVNNNKCTMNDSHIYLTEDIQDKFYNYLLKPYQYLIFKKEEFYIYFPKEKVDKLLELFSCEKTITEEIQYYFSENQFEFTPILKLENNLFINIFSKQLPISIYHKFYNHFSKSTKLKDKLRQYRERSLEKKVSNIFKNFFPSKNLISFENYYVIGNSEQDLILFYKGNVIIVETKACKLREPFRNVEKAIDRLKKDFNDSIQLGYNQCRQVEDLFFEDSIIKIKNKSNHILHEINPDEIKNIFSIVVTLERFGFLQTDLSHFLKIEDDVDFPWAVYIDDLETFLLSLKDNNKKSDEMFLDFLDIRRQLHKDLYSVDELDICAVFINNPQRLRNMITPDKHFITFLPDLQNYFDDLYFKGKLKFN